MGVLYKGEKKALTQYVMIPEIISDIVRETSIFALSVDICLLDSAPILYATLTTCLEVGVLLPDAKIT